MQWLHISDIHFCPEEDGGITNHLRDQLPKYLRSLSKTVDEVFFTGDYRFAKIQKENANLQVAKQAADYIRLIAECVGVYDTEHIHLVPGNHDLFREYIHSESMGSRYDAVDKIKASYDHLQGSLEKNTLRDLLGAFEFYKFLITELWDCSGITELFSWDNVNPHTYKECGDVVIVYLNTALVCVKGNEKGSLLVGHKYVSDMLIDLRVKYPEHPVIILGHHGISQLDSFESNELRNLFRDYGVQLYLCGHSHEILYERIGEACVQVTAGCIKQEKGVMAGFSFGEYTHRKSFDIHSYIWDVDAGMWGPYLHSEEGVSITASLSPQSTPHSLLKYIDNQTRYIDNQFLLNKTIFKHELREKTVEMFGRAVEECSLNDMYTALSSIIRNAVYTRWNTCNTNRKESGNRQVFMFSMEFLLGKSLENTLIYLDALDICKDGLAELGIDMDDLIDIESDAGLGNSGVGRSAVCFLDSLSSLGLPGHGFGIRYKYGFFKQKLVDGYQVELPDNWLREANVWEIRRPDKAVTVKFGGDVKVYHSPKDGNLVFSHEYYQTVLAMPYDMPILGYNGIVINTLRLWSAEAIGMDFNFIAFSRGDYISAVSEKYAVEAISEVLYPDDSNYKNKELRLKQQYFLVSAGIQSTINDHKENRKTIRYFRESTAIHLNDSQSALAIPELMRILLDEEGLSWEESWYMTQNTISHTNHSIVNADFEMWPIDMFKELLPRIYMIVEEIDRRFQDELIKVFPYDPDKVSRMAIIGAGCVRMVNLVVVGSFSVSGVTAEHSKLLETKMMKDFYWYYPMKINRSTIGVSHRRWLIKANPRLSALLQETIGLEWIYDPIKLVSLLMHKNYPSLKEGIGQMKRKNKEDLAYYIKINNGILVDIDSIFDVQLKSVSASKRQLLNALHILYLYNELKTTASFDLYPRTFIIAGKTEPSNYYAKNIIKLINEIGYLINNDPRTNDKIKLIFLENYNVNLAELVIPASDLSEQISAASTEALSTSSMKFMLNGAVTIGTGSGINGEILRLVGGDNFIRFGLTADDVICYYADGGYNSAALCAKNPRLSDIIRDLSGNLFSHLPKNEFQNITRSLLDYNDEFFVLGDFDSYVAAQRRVDALYRDKSRWQAMSVVNIAHAGYFSSDHTIRQLVEDIWRITP